MSLAESSYRTVMAFLFDGGFRQACRELRAVHTSGTLPSRAALHLAGAAMEQLRRWRQSTTDPRSFPTRLSTLSAAKEAWSAVDQDLTRLSKWIPRERVS